MATTYTVAEYLNALTNRLVDAGSTIVDTAEAIKGIENFDEKITHITITDTASFSLTLAQYKLLTEHG